ncbi:MAG: rRNA pseudouridine synthase [Chloroflexi bacterium]|nr:rRNA pseudouridine synthase [Chloroflexota bacterium]
MWRRGDPSPQPGGGPDAHLGWDRSRRHQVRLRRGARARGAGRPGALPYHTACPDGSSGHRLLPSAGAARAPGRSGRRLLWATGSGPSLPHIRIHPGHAQGRLVLHRHGRPPAGSPGRPGGHRHRRQRSCPGRGPLGRSPGLAHFRLPDGGHGHRRRRLGARTPTARPAAPGDGPCARPPRPPRRSFPWRLPFPRRLPGRAGLRPGPAGPLGPAAQRAAAGPPGLAPGGSLPGPGPCRHHLHPRAAAGHPGRRRDGAGAPLPPDSRRGAGAAGRLHPLPGFARRAGELHRSARPGQSGWGLGRHRPGPRGRPVSEGRYILFHKPYGVLSDADETDGRPGVATYVPLPGLFAAGRLDADSEGLLFLTDDGPLAHRLTHPHHKLPKTYLVLVEGTPDHAALAALRRGVTVRGQPTAPAQVRPVAPPDLLPRPLPLQAHTPTWLEIILREGRKRQVRHMTAAVGHPTLRLVRVGIGPLLLAGLAPGCWRSATPQELHALRAALRLP